jgi:hypothetical protein
VTTLLLAGLLLTTLLLLTGLRLCRPAGHRVAVDQVWFDSFYPFHSTWLKRCSFISSGW